LKGFGQQPKITSIGIVGHAIAPNESNVVGTLGGGIVGFALQFALDGSQIHHVLDNFGVVVQTEASPIDGFTKGTNVRSTQESIDDFHQSFQGFHLRGMG